MRRIGSGGGVYYTRSCVRYCAIQHDCLTLNIRQLDGYVKRLRNRIQSSYNSEGAGSSHLHSRCALAPTSPVSENESHAFDPMHYRSSSFKLIRIFVINVNHKEIDTQSKPTHDAQRSTSERRRHEPSISPIVRDQREERLGGTQIITHLAFVF